MNEGLDQESQDKLAGPGVLSGTGLEIASQNQCEPQKEAGAL